MATLIPEGKHAVLEINKMEARTTGAMVADRPFVVLNGEGKHVTDACLDNGTIAFYDTTKIGVTPANAIGCGLVYNTEHMYDERAKDLASFYTPEGEYARVYNFGPTDVITTNAVAMTVDAYKALNNDTEIALTVNADGLFAQGSAKTIAVGKKFTLPSGDPALKIYFAMDNADALAALKA